MKLLQKPTVDHAKTGLSSRLLCQRTPRRSDNHGCLVFCDDLLSTGLEQMTKRLWHLDSDERSPFCNAK
jgi:hypothetical protein